MNLVANALLDIPFKKWHLISVYTSKKERYLTTTTFNTLKKNGCSDALSLRFWDITDEQYEKIRADYPKACLFSITDAQRIVDFLDVIRETDDDALIIHCDAGISRSGAIGTFACDYFGLDYNEFMRENPYLLSNGYVLRMLHRCAGMTPIGAHTGIDERPPATEDSIF